MVWKCDHPQTRWNTYKSGQCRECAIAYQHAYQTPQERHQKYRAKVLPAQLERARRRVLHLEREAARLGFHDLLTKPETIDRAWEREIELAKLGDKQC